MSSHGGPPCLLPFQPQPVTAPFIDSGQLFHCISLGDPSDGHFCQECCSGTGNKPPATHFHWTHLYVPASLLLLQLPSWRTAASSFWMPRQWSPSSLSIQWWRHSGRIWTRGPSLGAGCSAQFLMGRGVSGLGPLAFPSTWMRSVGMSQGVRWCCTASVLPGWRRMLNGGLGTSGHGVWGHSPVLKCSSQALQHLVMAPGVSAFG